MRLHALFVLLALLLGGCGSGPLQLNLTLTSPDGLQAGDPIVIDQRPIGEVSDVTPDGKGGFIAHLSIEEEFRDEATVDAHFVVIPDTENPADRQVELRPGDVASKPLSDGATVRGTTETGALFQFGQVLRGFTEGLGILRDQVEKYRSELQRLPNSEEGQRLRNEWQRLMDEMKKAQDGTNDALRKEVVPKLQKDLDELQKQLQRFAQPVQP